MKYSAFQRCKDRPRRFKVSSERMHQIWVPPSKRAVSATVDQSSKRTVADRHRLAAYHNKHYWRAFLGYQHRWPWTTLKPKIWVCYFFSRFEATTHISRVNCAEIAGDGPRQPAYEIFSIKRRFLQCKFRPPRFKESFIQDIKFGHPLQNTRIMLQSTNLARERLQIDTDLLRIITSTADELSGGTNVDDDDDLQWR